MINMKFLFLAPRYHINMHYLVKSLIKNGQSVEMAVLYTSVAEDYSILKPTVLGFSYLFKFIKFFDRKKNNRLNNFDLKYAFPPILKLWKMIRLSHSDVIMVKNIESIFSLLAMIMARLLGKKIIILLQIKKYRKKFRSWSVFVVGKIFEAKVVTPILGNEIYDNGNDNLFYIPFVFDQHVVSKKYFQNDVINIVSVGKFQERKQQILLLEVLNKLKNRFNFQLFFIGQKDEFGYLKFIQEYVNKNNLQEKIEFAFDLSHERVFSYYEKSDLFILPSTNEPASFSLLEAMAYGLAVICSDANGTSCYIEEGINGYIFKDGEKDDLERMLINLFSNKDMISEFGEKSRKLIQTKYNLDIFYNSLMNIL